MQRRSCRRRPQSSASSLCMRREIDRVAGSLEANLAFTGTLGTPLVDGTLKLIDGEIDLYQINLALRARESRSAPARERARLQGLRPHRRRQRAAPTGELQWRDAQPYGKFNLKGLNLRVVDVPEARIDASPDLRVQDRRPPHRSERRGARAVREDRAAGSRQRRARLFGRSARRRRAGRSVKRFEVSRASCSRSAIA